jgi:molybdenum cofactor cytidylyltransferase
MSSSITGILLAAGQGKRFGGDKLMHRLADGTPMALAAARVLNAVLPGSVAVVSDVDSPIAQLLKAEGLSLLLNTVAHKGMGSSIACAVRETDSADGWVIALADMPGIPQGVVASVVAGLERGAGITAPVYNGQRGHPVGFSSHYRGDLLKLNGDEGARSIIARNSDTVELFEVQDAGVIRDIDRMPMAKG